MKSSILKTFTIFTLLLTSALCKADWKYHLEPDHLSGSMKYEQVQIISTDGKHSLMFTRTDEDEEFFIFIAHGKVIGCSPHLDCEIRVKSDSLNKVSSFDVNISKNFQSVSVRGYKAQLLKWYMSDAKQIKIEYTPYKEEPRIVVFETSTTVSTYWTSFNQRLGAKQQRKKG